jgi:excisionase family DNA binding protein
MLTTREVAKFLKVSEHSVRLFITSGKLKAYKVGRRWKVYEADLNEFVKGASS